MTTTRINKDGLQVASELQAFIDNELIPAIGVNADTFWSGFSKLVNDLAPKNAASSDEYVLLVQQMSPF